MFYYTFVLYCVVGVHISTNTANQIMSKRPRSEDETPSVYDANLGNINDDVKYNIREMLQFVTRTPGESLKMSCIVLMFVNKDWLRYMRDESTETWDTRMKRWYLAQLDPSELAYINYTENDKHIHMDEPTHIYTITHWHRESQSFRIIRSRPKSHPERNRGLLSSTGFKESVFPSFDADKVIAKMMAGRNWPYSKYYGQTPEQIKAGWDEIGDESSSAGTAMHLNLENYYNGKPYDSTTKEFALFRQFEATMVTDKLIPWRTEKKIFDIRLLLCGAVDILYIFKDPALRYDEKGRLIVIMGDWKRSREIKYNNPWKKKGCASITSHLDDCNYEYYRQQYMVYKMILERNENVIVKQGFLVVLHPNQDVPIIVGLNRSNLEEARIIKYRLSQIRGCCV